MITARIELLFEIWRDPQDGSCVVLQAGREADEHLARISPGSVLLHSFSAVSDFDAFQKNYDWQGWGRWKPEPEWEERFFSEEDHAKQQQSLAERSPSHED